MQDPGERVAGMKVKVTGVWRSVNYKAEGVGLVTHLSITPSQRLAVVVAKVTVGCNATGLLEVQRWTEKVRGSPRQDGGRCSPPSSWALSSLLIDQVFPSEEVM